MSSIMNTYVNHVKTQEHMDKQSISWNILIRKVRGNLSHEEEIQFQNWLNQEERHRVYYEQMCQVWSKDETTDVLTTDIDSLIAHFDMFVAAKQRERRHKVICMWRNLAACIFVCGMFIGSWFWFNRTEEILKDDQVKTEIVPGGHKAIILLASGEKIDLDSLTDTTTLEIDGFTIEKDSGLLQMSQLSNDAETFHTIFIPRGGEFRLKLEDGTMVWLNSETRLEIPSSFSKDNRTLSLSGEAYFAVAKNKQSSFIVKTLWGDIKVYGTEFNLKCYPEENQLKATLLEGVIGFNNSVIRELKLVPGEQLSFIAGNDNAEIKVVKVYNEIAWKNRQFCFENKRLEEIAQDLSRWYNVEFVFTDPSLKELEFSGTLNRYGEIETILNFFEEGVDVCFQTIQNKILVNRK